MGIEGSKGELKYDVVILGGGPAALSAAVAVRSRNGSVLVVGNDKKTSMLARAGEVRNYLGLAPQSGHQMLCTFYDHAKRMGAEFATGRITSVIQWDGYTLSDGDEIHQGTALILAPGVIQGKRLQGEEALLGHGVSYCATCDGILYRGKTVAVVGLSDEAPQEANYLLELGCRVTYIAEKRPEALRSEIAFRTGTGSKVAILGEQQLSGIAVDGETQAVDGVFVLREAVSPVDILDGLDTQGGHIQVDSAMKSNLSGVFAAGDCTGLPYQVSKAVGQGHVAGLSAMEYCAKQKR